MQQKQNLASKAANLAKSSPQVWREFLAAFADYANVHKDNLVNSQLADLPVNQGRAQSLATLHKIFSEALDGTGKP